MVFIVQISKQEYIALRKSGKLIRTPTGFDGVSICSKRKKGNGKTYYATDDLKQMAVEIIEQESKSK